MINVELMNDVITFTHCIHVKVYIVLWVSKYNVHKCMYSMCRCKCVHAVHIWECTHRTFSTIFQIMCSSS